MWNVANLDQPCQAVEGVDEGMEVAVRNPVVQDGPWVPLQIVYNGGAAYRNDCDTGNVSSITVRGYQVPVVDCSANQMHRYQITLCGNIVEDSESLQFRWMGSATGQRRSWNLDSVCVNWQRGSNTTISLLSDSFSASNESSCTNGNLCPPK